MSGGERLWSWRRQVLTLEAKSRRQERMVLDFVKLTWAAITTVEKERMAGGGRHPATGKMKSLLAAALGPSGGVAAGLSVSGGLGVVRPCGSAKRFQSPA